MRSLIRSAAATALVAAAGLVWAPSAAAAACSGDDGVTVVVDFHELGGGIDQDCVADQGTASDLFVAAGHSLENVQGQAFVCRVDALPGQDQESCARTPPPDRYWGLWWSDGESGSWTYATQGAYSLDVPDGGSVAFSWNGSSTKKAPGVAPQQHEPEPSQEPSTQQPSQPPSGGGGGGGGTGGSTPAGTTGSDPTTAGADGTRQRDGARGGGREGAQDRDGRREREDQQDRQDRRDRRDREAVDPTVEPSTASDATGEATAAEPPASASEDALPVWVGPSAVAGLHGVAGLATYLRRRAV